MNFRSHQSGVTMWGLFFGAFLVVIFALLLFKMLPPYLDDLKISSAMQSLKRQAAGSAMTRKDIFLALEKRFDIDSVTHVDIRRDVIISKRGVNAVVTIDYEAQVPLIFNISALMEFYHSVEVPTSD